MTKKKKLRIGIAAVVVIAAATAFVIDYHL